MSVRTINKGGRWRLEVDGRPFFIKGAVGRMYPERLVEAGGNAMRAGVGDLDRAQELGLKILAGLPLGKPRWGFDYADADALERQMDEAMATVRAHKDHPALLMWALGNEPEIHTTPEQREPMWREANRLAEAVKREDPNHPVITVLGDAYRRMLHELDELCPALDAVGLNSYADMLTLPEDVAREGWSRPYAITEFGPRGHWQVEKTAWGMPIEATSTQKADFYRRAYEHAVLGQPNCLGAFAFHWANHHEKTHTWYGMFLPDGSSTEAVEVMATMWNAGHPPAHRCPRIGPGKIALRLAGAALADGRVPAGARLQAALDASHPDGLPLTITWDLRPDVADNPNVGGDREEPVAPLDGSILSADGSQATVQLPAAPGKYRLFVYAHDPNGNAATANVPLLAG